MKRWHIMMNKRTGKIELIHGPKWLLENGAIKMGDMLAYIGVYR